MPIVLAVYSATLNQVDAGKNASKAYFLQILVPDDGKGEPVVFTRWGRVGEPGQQKTIDVSNETHAISEFKSRFKSKTSFPWEARATAPSKPGKYTWLDVDFGHDDTEGADEQEEAAGPSRAPTASPTKKAFPSKLSPSVQSLARLMFNQSIIDRTLAELKYDATKQPLGRIGGTTLKRALGVLSSISDALEQPGGGAQAQLQSLSNEYLSLIPHIFPRNTRPPVINNMEMVKNELDVLATLGEMEAGAKLMKSTTAGDVNPLDARIEGLKLNKLEVLEHDSKEFSILQDYALHTHGQTHQHLRYQVEDIFVVDRADDRANPLGNIGSKKLLWHGSRCSNWPGILSQGLRIAPPEAPVSGYMFGKGIYLADSMSKSAGYTYPHLSEDTGLLVLCEAELGKLLMLRHADYNADEKVKEAKAHSTLGMGQHIPASWKDCAKLGLTKDLKGVLMPVGGLKDDSDTDRSLMYNEYIVYNVEQVKFRYLFRIKFN
ncbi:PARP-domain-containing protein [Ceraceosorus guamensis]|uniref:Poly [ADP-ribose] polymerase n=1 Tax=Ceraceosorus guamensis TaxID=1522189 RepID=A0A316W1J9_9BASI|nr:PARP-domain-containing protein [Ceraceosorus guamensis]PWN43612.1 PARP-domain-containing protein [Ceraceosorus guamensis]